MVAERFEDDFVPVKSAIRTLEVIDLLARNPQGTRQMIDDFPYDNQSSPDWLLT